MSKHRICQLRRTLARIERKLPEYRASEDRAYAIVDHDDFSRALIAAGRTLKRVRRVQGALALLIATAA